MPKEGHGFTQADGQQSGRRQGIGKTMQRKLEGRADKRHRTFSCFFPLSRFPRPHHSRFCLG
jgi:hypothetical protein